MDVFSKITVSHFIWYLVPGLGLLFFLLFPPLAFKPSVAEAFLESLGPFGVIILGIILGFSADGLRLYRFRPHYLKIREGFFDDLQATIGTDLDPYFIQSHISDVARSKNVSGLSLHHAIWIMLGQFTIFAFMETSFWVLAALYFHYLEPLPYLLFGRHASEKDMVLFCAGLAVLFLFISLRFLYISIEDQKNTNTSFVSFAKQHREEIRKLLNLDSGQQNNIGT